MALYVRRTMPPTGEGYRDSSSNNVLQVSCFIDFILPAFLWGDPHIVTLDGRVYTYNGRGEHLMLEALSSNGAIFEQHANMERPMAADGTLAQATAFTAFAAKYNDSSTIQFSLSNDQKSKLNDNMLQQRGITSWFMSHHSSSMHYLKQWWKQPQQKPDVSKQVLF